jgi:hypothetical protein
MRSMISVMFRIALTCLLGASMIMRWRPRSTRGDSVDNDHACPRPMSVRCVIGSLWLLGHLPVHLPDLGLEPADVHARRRRLPPITCLYNERRPPAPGY